MNGKVESIEVWRLYVEDQEHRLTIDIENLAQSILSTGQINPIIVKKAREKGGIGEYRVIAGRRRFAALRHIQEELNPNSKTPVKAMVYVTDLNDLQEELVKIDENIMRENLRGAEFDEAIYRRKQIYEELHPETKQHISGGHGRKAKSGGGKKLAPGFSRDAAKKLGTSTRTVEKAVARVSRASEKVKKARHSGDLSPSKVDLLVTLPAADQDMLLTIAKKCEVRELKAVVDEAKRRGAKAVALTLGEVKEEDPRMKPLVKTAKALTDLIQGALEARLTLEGDAKHDSLRALDELAKRIEKFTSFQRAALGYVKAISRKDGQLKRIRGRA